MRVPVIVVALMLAPPSPKDEARFTVTVDLSAVDGATMGDDLINAAYKSLLLRLIEEGYLVAEPGSGGDIRVKVAPLDERSTIAIRVRTSVGETERIVQVGSRAGEEIQLQLVHEALDLVRQAREALVLATQRQAPAPKAPPAAIASEPAATPTHLPPKSERLAVQAGGAAMWSGSSLGMLANLDGMMIRGRWQVAVGGFVHAPLDTPQELHVFEWGGIEAGLNASHMLGPHHILFEGNQSFNMDSDDTHGNTTYVTYFRNWVTTTRAKFVNGVTKETVDDTVISGGPRRAAGAMRYSRWMSYVGNVLGVPGVTTAAKGYVSEADSLTSQAKGMMWMLGWNDSAPYTIDPGVAETAVRDGNWDSVLEEQTWKTSSKAPLPDSLYLSGPPAFFKGYRWPWVDPATGTVYKLPAHER